MDAYVAIGVGANNPNQALPYVVGQVAQSSHPKRLVLSHIANFDLHAAIADVKKTYTGPLTVGADLQCYQHSDTRPTVTSLARSSGTSAICLLTLWT